MTRFAVVPPVPALLPEYAGLADPLAELRAAAVEAAAWLVSAGPERVEVWGDPLTTADRSRGVPRALSVRVARWVLDAAGFAGAVVPDGGGPDGGGPGGGGPDGGGPDGGGPGGGSDGAVLVLANGTARRGEEAPGHLDPRAAAYDGAVETALATGDAAALAGLNVTLGRDLHGSGLEALRALGRAAADRDRPAARLCYAGDPFGVRYWVATWSSQHRRREPNR